MPEPLTQVVAWFAVAVAFFAAVHTVRHLPFSNPLFFAIAALELALVALFVVAVVAMVRTSQNMDSLLFVSYFVVTVLVAPAAVLWGIADKSRWGTGVVVVAMLTVGVLLVRLLQIWNGVDLV